MKVTFFAREFPPNVYGGAGVHLKNLARELSRVIDVEVRCFGEQDLSEEHMRVLGYRATTANALSSTSTKNTTAAVRE